MKLYTRLINEGVFVFWNPDEGNTSYKLKIKIVVGDDKIELVNLDINKGENYYSFSGIGSGDYEIELIGFKDNRSYQNETKKIKIVSSVQKEQEQADKIMAAISEMNEILSSMKSKLSFIESNTSDISSLTALTDPETAYRFISDVYDWHDCRGGWRG
jgi:hypothetical protein